MASKSAQAASSRDSAFYKTLSPSLFLVCVSLTTLCRCVVYHRQHPNNSCGRSTQSNDDPSQNNNNNICIKSTDTESTEVFRFVSKEVFACEMKNIMVVTDGRIYEKLHLSFLRLLGIPYTHQSSNDLHLISEWLPEFYVTHNMEYFIVASRRPDEVLREVELIYQERSREELALLPHRTKWLVIVWTTGQWDDVIRQQHQSPLDNVAVMKVASVSSEPTMNIENIVTFVWRQNRTKEAIVLKHSYDREDSDSDNDDDGDNDDDDDEDGDMTDICQMFPNREGGLNGRLLTAFTKAHLKDFYNCKTGAIEDSSNYRTENGSNGCSGTLLQIIDYMADAMNFTYEIIPEPYYASRNVSWSDFTQTVINRSVDIGLSPWSILTAIRFNITMSYPILFDDVIGVYRRPPPGLLRPSVVFVCPFPSMVYVYLTACLVYMSILYFLICHFGNNIIQSGNKDETRSERTSENSFRPKTIPANKIVRNSKVRKNLVSYAKIVFEFFVATMNQCYLPRPKRLSSRLVVGVWALGMVFFYAIFCSYITAEMVNGSDKAPISSFKHLSERGDFKCTTLKGYIVQSVLDRAKTDLLIKIRKKLTLVVISDFGTIDDGLKNYLANLEYKTVFLFFGSAVRDMVRTLPNAKDYMFLQNPSLFSSPLSLMFPYQSELNTLMSKELLHLFESGRDTRIFKNYYDDNVNGNFPKPRNFRKKKNVPLHMEHFFILLVCCVTCLGLSIVVLVLERLVHRSRPKERKGGWMDARGLNVFKRL